MCESRHGTSSTTTLPQAFGAARQVPNTLPRTKKFSKVAASSLTRGTSRRSGDHWYRLIRTLYMALSPQTGESFTTR